MIWVGMLLRLKWQKQWLGICKKRVFCLLAKDQRQKTKDKRLMKPGIILFIVLAYIITGCDLFTTRTPEEPEEGTNIEWQFPHTPRLVVENLEVAISRKSSVDYMKSFIASNADIPEFIFEADPNTKSNNPGVFDDWDIECERSFVHSLFSLSNLPRNSLAELTIELTREPIQMGDSAGLSAEYNLHLEHTRNSAPRQMQGQLSFGLRRAADGGWYIQYWQDECIGGSQCWSDLKAEFYLIRHSELDQESTINN